MKNWMTIFLIAFVAVASSAQERITIEDIYQKGTFRQRSVGGLNWLNEGGYYTAQVGSDIVKYDVTSGEMVETILDGDLLEPSITYDNYSFSADQSKILLRTNTSRIYRRSFTARYYVYDLETKSLTDLSTNGVQSYATFSPDGNKVGFVRNNNLYFVDLVSGSETQVTQNGKFNQIINGSTDWVYEEELSLTRAYEWSGDSKYLFYLIFDESGVKEYNMQRWNDGQLYPEDYRYKYPKAGEDNSILRAALYNVENGTVAPISLGGGEYYIARIHQTKNPEVLSLVKLNRLQNELNILHLNVDSGDITTVYTDKSDTYIDIDFVDDLTYLEDGKSFLMTSERDGFKHIYIYNIDGTLKNQVTSGNWEVSALTGVDQSGKRLKLYYTSTEDSPLERYLYVVEGNGQNKKKISTAQGVHRINMSPDCSYYMDYYSSANKPLEVTLYQTKGNKVVKAMEDNAALAEASSAFGLQTKEFFTFNTTDGTALNGYMLKPAGFSESNSYPVLIYQYSGPGSQNVTNSWGGGHFYWHQMLVQEGYMVVVIDTRGTGARGAAFRQITYGQLGKYEVEDHIEGAKYLAGLPYVDENRIGIWGWSYGGYMSSLAILKGNDVFKAAIAVAPVTNWRYYDTIYTERYMGLPQDNADGYDNNSPTTFAEKLEGNFFLIHGTGDDNVHFQNSVALQNALIANGKQFDSFYYPDRAHGIYRGNARPHLYVMMTDWLKDNL